MNAPDRPRLLVDLVSDPVCPWCYIGLKSFQAAKTRLKSEFIVLPRIRAYQLNPDTPAEGTDRKDYYARKFPDEAERVRIAHQLKAAAIGAGFVFDPAKPARLPNTLKAHQLIRLAHFDGAQERLALLLYESYWQKGEDIGDVDVLAAIAEQAGLDRANALAVLNSERDAEEIKSEADAFRQAGVSGVPTFIVNERTGFSGALPPSRLADALRQAAAQPQI